MPPTYTIVWQSSTMPAPAFWRYRRKAEAEIALAGLKRDGTPAYLREDYGADSVVKEQSTASVSQS